MEQKIPTQVYCDVNLTNYISKDFLHINSAGVSRYSFAGKPFAVRYHRPSGRVDCHLLFATHGHPEATVNGVLCTLNEGDCVFYGPNDPQDYTFTVTKQEPLCESLYIHFSGSAAAEALSRVGLTHSCIIPRRSHEAKKLFLSVISSNRTGAYMAACGHLLCLLPHLSPDLSEKESESARRIRAQVEYISSHFAEEIDVDDCAERCGLSRSRFSHLFTDSVGMPPYKYQLSLRIDAACDLLTRSTLSVGEIAASVGFSDQFYFSRIFKKTVGCSPSEFRAAPIRSTP